jgi:hypothetical protein
MIEFVSLEELVSRKERKDARFLRKLCARFLGRLLPGIDLYLARFVILGERGERLREEALPCAPAKIIPFRRTA